MAFRFLISALALCLSVGFAFAQNTATPVITGYLSTSGCASAALTPCFIQFGAGGGGGGGNVVITGPLGQAAMAASIPVAIASNQSAVPVSLSGSTSNAGSAVATSSTNVPTVSYNYGFNGTTWDQLQVDGSKNLKTTTIGTGSAGSAATGVVTIQGIASMTPILTSGTPGSRTLVTLDVKTVTTGGTAVTALTSGHKSAGGWIQNPPSATVNLCVNEISTAAGSTTSGDTTCIQPGQTYYLTASTGAVSVISSDSSHPFGGYGLQ